MCMTSAACHIGARCTRSQRQLRRRLCTRPRPMRHADPQTGVGVHVQTPHPRGTKDAHPDPASHSPSPPPPTRERARPHPKPYASLHPYPASASIAHAVARCSEQKPKLAALDDDEDGAEGEGEGDEENAHPRFFIPISDDTDICTEMRECAVSISISISISFPVDIEIRSRVLYPPVKMRECALVSASKVLGSPRPGHRKVVVCVGGRWESLSLSGVRERGGRILEVAVGRGRKVRYSKPEGACGDRRRLKGNAEAQLYQIASVPTVTKTCAENRRAILIASISLGIRASRFCGSLWNTLSKVTATTSSRILPRRDLPDALAIVLFHLPPPILIDAVSAV
ncbi:hypothetical protein B0H13DRAFT_2676588 [Mycena leptocephala]|nr:hypothetical protein B0H13DRAFT_2676588 [Mycena leptocephala]